MKPPSKSDVVKLWPNPGPPSALDLSGCQPASRIHSPITCRLLVLIPVFTALNSLEEVLSGNKDSKELWLRLLAKACSSRHLARRRQSDNSSLQMLNTKRTQRNSYLIFPQLLSHAQGILEGAAGECSSSLGVACNTSQSSVGACRTCVPLVSSHSLVDS